MRTTIAAPASLAVVLSLVWWSCSSTVTEQAERETTIFSGARVIVGDGRLIDRADFVVEGERVIAVGPVGQVSAPAGAKRIDVSGKTVMPAIIDAHSHPGYTNLRTGTTSWENYTREHLVENLERMAYYGVGTTLSLGEDGGHGDLPFSLSKERVANAARFMTAGGGIGMASRDGRPGARSWTAIGSAEEAMIAVRALAPRQPSAIMLWADDHDRSRSAMPPRLQRAVTSEAHRFLLRVIAHANTASRVRELVLSRVDVLANMVRDTIDRDLLRVMNDRGGLGILSVLPPPENDDRGYTEADLPWIAETVPSSQIERMRERLNEPIEASQRNPHDVGSFALQARNLVLLRDNEAARIGFGTGGFEGWTAHMELADMVRAGLTPMEAIVAATRSNAALLAEWDYGTIDPGQFADFIVLDANPLDDISNTRRIHEVYLRGTRVDREALRTKLSAEPAF